MSRYIDADKLRKDEIARCHCVPCVGSNDNNYKDLDEVLNDAPTADVVKVRHGQWIPVEGDVIFQCSICEAEISTSWDYENENMFAYCPCCGSKMDGERSENGT